MLELEKKYWKEYRIQKKEQKAINKVINENKQQFYQVFRYLIQEYYKSFKKEFPISEIVSVCKTKDVVMNEITSFFNSKKLAKCEKDKIIINYETIVALNDIIKDYKKLNI